VGLHVKRFACWLITVSPVWGW